MLLWGQTPSSRRGAAFGLRKVRVSPESPTAESDAPPTVLQVSSGLCKSVQSCHSGNHVLWQVLHSISMSIVGSRLGRGRTIVIRPGGSRRRSATGSSRLATSASRLLLGRARNIGKTPALSLQQFLALWLPVRILTLQTEQTVEGQASFINVSEGLITLRIQHC